MNRADELGFKGGVFYENMTFEEFCALNAQRLENKKEKSKHAIYKGLIFNLSIERKHEYDMARLDRLEANSKRLDERLDRLEADFKQIGEDQTALRERINRFQENAKAFIVLGNCLKNSIE